MSVPPSLAAYQAAMRLAEPLAPIALAYRARRGKEDPARLNERLGRPAAPRPPGPLAWLHAASVGESLSLLPLIERLGAERPDIAVLVTSGTRTSAELLANRLPAGAIHQYVPLDGPAATAGFADHWRPDVGVFVESELWPNLILAARERGARLALVSARITESSARRWARQPAAAHVLMDAFELILAQDDLSAERIEGLGGRVAGELNLKRFGAPLPADAKEVATFKTAIGRRHVLLAASTHPGEEGPIAAALTALPDRPLLIIAPRHPDRGDAVAALLSGAGYAVARRGAGEPVTAQTDVYLADTLGEMGLFYRLAQGVVMGGGFAQGIGGHNPLEPARLGVGVISGPRVFNFESLYAEMAAAGGALIVRDAGELTAIVRTPQRLTLLAEKAAAFAAAQDGGFEAAWRLIQPLLPPR